MHLGATLGIDVALNGNKIAEITENSAALNKGTNYEVSYNNNTNVETAAVTVKMKGNYSGTATKMFEITQRGITNETTITLNPEQYAYNGK